jgi:hypothetical protein
VVPEAGTEVVATDTSGRPALLLRRVGAGSLILCTYPVEHMAACTPAVNPDDAVTLYGALATHAGVSRPVTAEDPRVACDVLVRADGARFAFLVSHAGDPLTVKPTLESGWRLTTVTGEDVTGGVTIEPFGINVFLMTEAG